MNPLRWLVLRARAVVARRALERDMQEEMREHLARATDRFVARGMSPVDARIAARREFGNVGVLQEEGRDARGGRWIDELASDLRFASRYFARNKLNTATVVAVLALGIGANTAIFSALQGEFVRPAPAVPKDDAHVRIHCLEQPARGTRWRLRDFSYPELRALAQRRESFADVAGWAAHDVVLDAGDSLGARGVGAEFVTPNFFAALGVRLVAGPGFVQHESQVPDKAAIVSFAMAEDLYGTPANAVGRRIVVNEVPVRIAGVAPPGFQGAIPGQARPALWIPVSARAEIARVSPRWLVDESSLNVFARLAPSVTREQATAIARLVVAQALPDSAARVGMLRSAEVLAMRAPPPLSDPEDFIALTVIGAIGVLILLVACTNVSSLMVAAAVGRRHEIAVRISLGASRWRLLRQLLTETVLLAVAGGAVGLMLYGWLAKWLVSRGAMQHMDLAPDLGTFAFMMAVALGTGVLFGLSPALHATRVATATALRDAGAGATRRSRLQRTLVIAQIVLSQPLLVLLAVMLSAAFGAHDPLPRTVSEYVVATAFGPLAHTDASGQRGEAVDSLVPRLAVHPSVVSVVPEAAAFAIRNVIAMPDDGQPVGAPANVHSVHVEGAAPGWFTLLDVPILLGRDVSLADTSGAGVAVVIASDFARTLWGAANPIGRRLAPAGWRGGQQDSLAMTVVGVFDAAHATTRGSAVTRVYTARGRKWRRDVLLIRTRGSAESLMPELRRFIRTEAPTLPVLRMETLTQLDAAERRIALQVAGIAGGAGALALLLASLGLYGVVALAVEQRKREIGIRIAVGAKPSRVARAFLVSGMRVSAMALLLGLPVSIAGLRVLLTQGIVIAPQVNVWLIGLGIAFVLLLVASAATWLPARQAALVDPAATMRVE